MMNISQIASAGWMIKENEEPNIQLYFLFQQLLFFFQVAAALLHS